MSYIAVFASQEDAKLLEPHFEAMAHFLQASPTPTEVPVRLMVYNLQYGGSRFAVQGVWIPDDTLAATPPAWLGDWAEELREHWVVWFKRLPEKVQRQLDGDAIVSVMFVQGITLFPE